MAGIKRQVFEDYANGDIVAIGNRAPSFVLPDSEGRLCSLEGYEGDKILLVFGNTGCPHCLASVPLLEKLDSGSFAEGLKVVFVALGDSIQGVQEYIEQAGISFDVLVDSYGITGLVYNITHVPQAFIVDPDGVIERSTAEEETTLWQLL
jgi:peroxiredoxin